MQTQLDLKLILDEFVNPKAAFQILRALNTLQKNQSLAILRIAGFEQRLVFFEELYSAFREIPPNHC